jgi:hypothetical protein
MDFDPESNSWKKVKYTGFAEPPSRKPLEFLRDTEGLLRRQTVDVLAPILPQPLANKLQVTSVVAEDSLSQLAEIDIDRISDLELQPARILIGLSFVGFGGLAIALLILYLCALHPKLSPFEQIRRYWHQYIWFVCLGVTGLFMLGREAMRTRLQNHLNSHKSS